MRSANSSPRAMIATRTVRLIRRDLERVALKVSDLLCLGCCDDGGNDFSLDHAISHVNNPVGLLRNLLIMTDQD